MCRNKIMGLKFVLVCIGITCGGLALAAPQQTGSIKGNILVCGQIERGVLVSIPGTGLDSQTDRRGNFTLKGIPAGAHNVVVSRADVTLGTIEAVPVTAKMTTNVGQQEFCDDADQQGFGQITGGNQIDDELLKFTWSLITNEFDFGSDPYDDADFALLTPDAQKVLADSNLGPNIMDEAFSMELLVRAESAQLLKTSTEIIYDDPSSKKSSNLIQIGASKIGVLVTRAVKWPPDSPLTTDEAKSLLEGKLDDIVVSSANVSAADAWQKQILHVFSYSPENSAALVGALPQISSTLLADTIIVITTTNGDDEFLYF